MNVSGESVSFSIKKANSYMSLKTQHLQFLDIRSYLAPLNDNTGRDKYQLSNCDFNDVALLTAVS